MAKKLSAPVHPGRVLHEKFLTPAGISQYRLAKDVGVPAHRMNEIVLGKRSISADSAIRLARYFGNKDEYWMHLQVAYDLAVVRKRLGRTLDRDLKPRSRTAPKRGAR